MKVSISREYEFAAAHELPFHGGKCQRMHGHNYGLTVCVTGPINTSGESSHGMVMDFAELDACVQRVLDELDHRVLNEVMSRYPTAEVVALYIFEILDIALGATMGVDVEVQSVRLSETPRSWAEVTR